MNISIGTTVSAGAGTGDMLAANNLGDVSSTAASRTNLGLAIGTNVQAYNAGLTGLAGITYVQNSFPARTTSGTGAPDTPITIGSDFSISGNTLSLANAYQPIDADLSAIAGLTLAQNKFYARTGSGSGVADTVILIGSDFSLSGNTLSLANSYVIVSGALGTPSSGTLSGCTGLPVAGITASTSTALGVGSVELGHATDTTLNRLAAGIFAVETDPLQTAVSKVTGSNYTIGTTNPRELYGGIIYVTGAATITIPAVAVGARFTVVTIGAVAVSVDPNAADLICLDGTALSDGDKITNLSTAGDIAQFAYYDATGWFASTNGWTDGN